MADSQPPGPPKTANTDPTGDPDALARWGRPQDPAMHLALPSIRLLDGRENTADHAAGRIPQAVKDAGFADEQGARRLRTVLGTLELLKAS